MNVDSSKSLNDNSKWTSRESMSKDLTKGTGFSTHRNDNIIIEGTLDSRV
jgi:hypothetical protein